MSRKTFLVSGTDSFTEPGVIDSEGAVTAAGGGASAGVRGQTQAGSPLPRAAHQNTGVSRQRMIQGDP